MPLLNPNYVAGEDLYPARFVKRATDEGNAVLMSDDGTTAPCVGVTHNGTREAPIPSVTTAYAALDGEPVRVHGLGDTCEVEAGETLTDGAEVAAGTDGVAMLATAGDYVSGIVQKGDSVAGEMAWIQVVNYQKNA
jgi:hypothetical protein